LASAVINLAPEGSLSRYLQEVRKFPMLSAEEEFVLSKQWRDQQDVDAAHRLVTSHLRLVAKIAMGYRGHGLPVGELISEGNIGMMRAVTEIRSGSRVSPGHLRHVVDSCRHPGIHPA
jgi:RNA polymerase sigma-32 factor